MDQSSNYHLAGSVIRIQTGAKIAGYFVHRGIILESEPPFIRGGGNPVPENSLWENANRETLRGGELPFSQWGPATILANTGKMGAIIAFLAGEGEALARGQGS